MRLTIVWNEADARSRLTIAVNQCVNLTLIYIVFVRVAMNVNLKFVRVYFITIIYAGGHAPGGLGSVCPSCLPRQLVVGLAHRPHRRPVLPCLRPRSVAILRLTRHHHLFIIITHLPSSSRTCSPLSPRARVREHPAPSCAPPLVCHHPQAMKFTNGLNRLYLGLPICHLAHFYYHRYYQPL